MLRDDLDALVYSRKMLTAYSFGGSAVIRHVPFPKLDVVGSNPISRSMVFNVLPTYYKYDGTTLPPP